MAFLEIVHKQSPLTMIHTIGVVICLVTLSISHSSHAQKWDPKLAKKFFLRYHNEARAQVGVEPLEWDETLAAYAQKLGDEIKPVTLEKESFEGPYGDNAAYFYDGFPTRAVQGWVAEKDNYDYASNSCAKGKTCQHYLQVVWRNTTRIGCVNDIFHSWWPFSICQYYPPGNVPGQRPY